MKRDYYDAFIPSFFAPTEYDILSIANSLNLLRAARIIHEESHYFPEIIHEPTNQAILAAAELQTELVRESHRRAKMAELRRSYRYPWSH